METIYFQIFGLLDIILLIWAYFSKKRINNYENRIYKYIVITNFIGQLLHISCFFTIRNMDVFPLFNEIVSKSYLIYLVIWLLLNVIYILTISIIQDSDDDSSKNKKYSGIKYFFFIVSTLSMIFIALLPIYYNNDSTGLYTYGPSVNFIYIMSSISIVITLMCILIKRKNIKLKKILPLISFILMAAIVMLIQHYNPQLLLMTSMETFITLLMYFTIENPDMKMIEQLNIAKEQAEHANNAKSDFLSSMSHEIRTPLNAIVGFSECIKDADTIDEAKENATDVIGASATLLEIVNGILDISKIEAGKLEIISSDYDSKELFESIRKLSIARLGDKALDFRVSIANDIPPVLYGDHSNIKKVIINLLTNAIKYTETGFVDFKVMCVNMNNICRLVVSVEDSGRGIKKENIDKLFTKFQRLDEDRNTTIEGTGLGLAITKQLVELMGGKIVVQSIYGEGSKFTVAIDQRIENKPLEEINKKVAPIEAKIDLAGKNILVVDDNKLNLKIAKKLLSYYNPTIITVETGKECIDLIKSGTKYDLILMDDMMPHMNGIEVLNELKKLPNFSIPVVALTANALTGIREKYLSEGFNDYLSKPIDRSELFRILTTYINDITVKEVIIPEEPKVATLAVSPIVASENNLAPNIAVSATPQTSTQLDLTSKRILIVDDNKLNIKIATTVLKPYNPTVEFVLSGKECIDKILNNEKYDLIFMDDMMPEMSGVETFKKIQELKTYERPIVVLTANAVDGSREKYLADGFDDYLSKPIIKSEFDRVLRTFIK